MKIATILGTRPEIIKLSPLIPLLEQEFEHFILHTGQHYDYEMDEVFFIELQLPRPKYNLKIGSGPQGRQTGLMLEKIEEILIREKPDLVLVEGDVNTVLAGALAAAKLHIPLLHVEAGCRSFNREMPEEVNRIVADHLTDYLAAPDKESVQNLQREGIAPEKIFLTGSTVFDAVERNKRLARPEPLLKKLGLAAGEFVLATLHRAENTDNRGRLERLIAALNELAETVTIVFPIHPRTRKYLTESNIPLSRKMKSIEPLPYLSFLALLSACKICLSDSGGIQEEALAFNVPCLIPREETEWIRVVNAGKNLLVGTTTDGIVSHARRLIDDSAELKKVKDISYPFSPGASRKILEIIKNLEDKNRLEKKKV